MELMRFFMVAVVGLVLDTCIAWVLSQRFGVPLTLSSASGFLCAAILNYMMHELWTFKHGHQKLSMYRAFTYAGVLIITLLTRVLAVHTLQFLLSPTDYTLVILLISAGVSFFVSYIISRTIFFKNQYSR